MDDGNGVLRERLARIETSQAHIMGQTDKIVTLLGRLVLVEEHVNVHKEAMARLYERLEAAEEELENWKSARRILSWVSGIAAAAMAMVIAYADGAR